MGVSRASGPWRTIHRDPTGAEREGRPRRGGVVSGMQSRELHAWRRRFSGREPTLHFRYVAFRIFCELFETTGAAECVLAFGSLDGETLLSLLGDVDDHVADRVEHLSFVRHPSKVAEFGVVPRSG